MKSKELGICPICGDGNLHELEYETEIERCGVIGKVVMKLSECDACYSECATDTQLSFNKAQVINFTYQASLKQ